MTGSDAPTATVTMRDRAAEDRALERIDQENKRKARAASRFAGGALRESTGRRRLVRLVPRYGQVFRRPRRRAGAARRNFVTLKINMSSANENRRFFPVTRRYGVMAMLTAVSGRSTL